MPGSRDLPSWAAAMEAIDDTPASPSDGDTIGDVIARRYNRRDFVKGALGVTAATALFGPAALAAPKTACVAESEPGAFTPPSFAFDEIEAGADDNHHVAEGYDALVLLSWGDHLGKPKEDAPFEPLKQSGSEQRERFGYNNDYIAYFPIDGSSEHGLLCVNHEYAEATHMFPGVETLKDDKNRDSVDDDMVDVEMAALGVSVVEIKKLDGKWTVVYGSPLNRRITANEPMALDGPVANDEKALKRLRTKDDPDGRNLRGTVANCAGGKTPWGTYLAAEENFHYLFWTEKKDANGDPHIEGDHSDYPANYRRYQVPKRGTPWGRKYPRFNVDEEPNEPNRFGWIVEIDPYDKHSKPVKHTALGRFFHEGAETVLSKKNKAVVFTGDDAKSEYVYRFVSDGTYVDDASKKAENMKLLSAGTLSVARFNDDGTGEWVALTPQNCGGDRQSGDGWFCSQADILIDARLAADQVEATKMDRPEDVQPNEKTGRVYVMLTNNVERNASTVNRANPRANNRFGHVIEIIPDDADFGANRFTWDILVRCGDPDRVELGAYWNAATSKNSWFVSPDNATVDCQGRLWIATDQGRYWQQTMHADGLYALETHGIRRGTPRMFFRVPVGAELCGPCFTPDGETLFVAVQHPGADGMKGYCDGRTDSKFDCSKEASFDNPATRWPDFQENMPPRPSVVAITRTGGGKIGG
ncbi:PhoX family protein [Methyloceanibacter caenitepidi]|nr:PhoX family phosphatase [Methyloceanibacter caenitepidi]